VPGCLTFNSLSELPRPFGPCAITVGNFDGVHAGHRALIRRTVEVALENGWRAAALTFHPHPTKIVAPQKSPPLLSTVEERAALMCGLGLDAVVVLPFNKDVAWLSADDFVRTILLEELGARAILVGDNFRFGRNAAGNTATLSKLVATEIVNAVHCRGQVVSSSAVRHAVREGRVTRAWRMLQRPFSLKGEVVSGAGIGSRQTVPTLNLNPSGEVLPARGVYVTRTHDAERGRTWDSVTNVGYRPTFGGENLTVETFLLGPLDGESPRRIRVEFLYRLRDERKFDDAGALKQQILRDVGRARKFHRRILRAGAII